MLSSCNTLAVNTQSPVNALNTPPSLSRLQFEEGKSYFLNNEYQKAAELLLPLAMQGNTQSQYAVGYLFYYGFGLPRHEGQARHWIKIAAEGGSKKAQTAFTLLNSIPNQQTSAKESVVSLAQKHSD